MTDYAIKFVFDDKDEPVIVALPGLRLEDAERFTGQLRYDVLEAKKVNAPVVEEMNADIPGTDLVFDPRRVVAIDLEEADPDDGPQAQTGNPGEPVELDGPLDPA